MTTTDDAGRQIRAAREQRGLSQSQLAAQLEVSRKTVGSWERTGSVPHTRWVTLVQLLDLKAADSARHLDSLTTERPAAELLGAQHMHFELKTSSRGPASLEARLRMLRNQLTLARAEVDDILEALANDKGAPHQ